MNAIPAESSGANSRDKQGNLTPKNDEKIANLNASILCHKEAKVPPVWMADNVLEATELLQMAKAIYAMRRKRSAYLGEEIFGEPAWDMLLDLFIAHVEGRRISITSCTIASAAPTSTGLRYIRSLEKAGLVVRRSAKEDRRRSFVSLTQEGASTLVKILRESIDRFPRSDCKKGK